MKAKWVEMLDSLKAFMKRPENWINLLTLIVAVIMGYWSISSGEINNYLQALLTTLGILALGQLFVGWSSAQRDRDISKLSQSIVTLRLGKSLVSNILVRRGDVAYPRDIDERFPNGMKTLDLMGFSWATWSVGTIVGWLEKRIESGMRIRILVTDPEDISIHEIIARKRYDISTPEKHSNRVRASLSNFAELAERINAGNKVLIKTTHHLPSFTYIGIDTNTPTGWIQIRLHLTQRPPDDDVSFAVESVSDLSWFYVFREQFEILWREGDDFSIS